MDTSTNRDTQAQTRNAREQPYTILTVTKRFLLTRHFALLWTGQTVSAFGSYITLIGLPLIARLLLRASNAQIGLLTALGELPGLLLGLLVGVWVDRLPRRPLLLLADLGRAALLALIPLLALLGLIHLVWLAIVTMGAGLLTVSFEIASLSFLPTLLPPDKLTEGNSRLGTSSSLAEIAGPPIAGLLIQLLTAPVAVLLDILSFLFSTLCVGLMRVPELPPVAPNKRGHVWHEMHEGLRLLWQNRMLRATAAYICTHNFFGGAYAALYLLYVLKLFGTNPLAFGILVALGGVGALAGSFCANYCARRIGSGRVLVVSALFSGWIAFCTPLAMGPLPLVFTLMALAQLIGDAGFAIYAINEISLRQTLAPEHLQGRVNACMHILANGSLPLGTLLAGLLSEVIGIRWTLLIGSSGIFLATGWLISSPLWRHK